jgi:hypothetical protein
MALNLIDLAKDYLTPEVISKMAGLVGESPAATQKTPHGAGGYQEMELANTGWPLFQHGTGSEMSLAERGLCSYQLGNAI